MSFLNVLKKRAAVQKPTSPEKILIIVRAGKNSLHRSWSSFIDNDFDLAISSYDDSDFSGETRFAHRCRGGKYIGLHDFFTNNRHILDDYGYFWLVEDDLFIPRRSLLNMKKLIFQYGFSLIAPSLCPSSFYSWPSMLRNNNFLFRMTDFVEQMAPVMSRSLLTELLPSFRENHSGWGYEWFWKEKMAQRGEYSIIADCAPVTHTRPIRKGDLYSNTGVDPEAELSAFLNKYNLTFSRETRTFYAADINGFSLDRETFLARARSGSFTVFEENLRREALDEVLATYSEDATCHFGKDTLSISNTLRQRRLS